MMDLLPDSRMKSPTGSTRIHWGEWGMLNMQPIFCANCGKLGAYTPEENITFAFWLCDHPCAEQWGHLAGTYTSPDEVYWEKVKGEMMEQHGHYLDEAGVLQAEANDGNSLATLLKESPIQRR